ncbi:unnamed protein product [Amoebophrya sp. A120]|nr:unnamed protein product [Amoebophrya sp. A120]|eukprot:GSA120T00014953001.1
MVKLKAVYNENQPKGVCGDVDVDSSRNRGETKQNANPLYILEQIAGLSEKIKKKRMYERLGDM